MTLMPVSNISSEVDCSSKAGAWRWMGMCTLAFTGPSSSTGSPSTFSTRPRVSRAHRHHDAVPGVMRVHAAHHALGRNHCDAAHAALAQMLLHLDHDIPEDSGR